MDLCSAIVYCAPENIDALTQWLNTQEGVDTHQIDINGKIIITVEDVEQVSPTETTGTKYATEIIADIEKNATVLSVMLVSQFSNIEAIA